MNTQTGIVLAIVLAAAAYTLRNFMQGLTAKGCASGCGSCASSHCSMRKLEALKERSK